MSCSPMSAELIDAYSHHRNRGSTLIERYAAGVLSDDDLDEFLRQVRSHFWKGVHLAFKNKILRTLTDDLGTQQDVAEALGLKDRTSISHMAKSDSMEGVRITTALYQYPEAIPSRELAALFGFARATSFIKAQVMDDPEIEGTMSAQDFSYVVGALASERWEAALRDPDPAVARQVAQEIICERTVEGFEPPRARRPENYVGILRERLALWADYAVAALCAIPECIPEDEEDAGRREVES
jgi:hypothetical protein